MNVPGLMSFNLAFWPRHASMTQFAATGMVASLVPDQHSDRPLLAVHALHLALDLPRPGEPGVQDEYRQHTDDCAQHENSPCDCCPLMKIPRPSRDNLRIPDSPLGP